MSKKLVNRTGKSTVSCGWSHARVSCECPTHDSWGGLTPGPVVLYTTTGTVLLREPSTVEHSSVLYCI